MPQRTVVVGSKVGLHARPAALFVKAAAAQPVAVTIAKPGGGPVPANSILSVLTLDAKGGEEVVLNATASDRGTRVSGSSYLFDQQIARFLSTLPPVAA
jgi:phosphocarrier protein